MRASPKIASCWWLCAFAVFFSLQTVPRIFIESPINDEPIDLTDGYFYWKGDVTTDGSHPPFLKMLQALPLRAMNLSDSVDPKMKLPLERAYNFLFVQNKEHFEGMVSLGRFTTLFFALGIGWLIFRLTRKGTLVVCISAMILWVFEPTTLAFSSLCGSDIPGTFFFVSAILVFQKFLENRGVKWGLALGTLTTMAVFSKFSNLFLVPIFIILELAQVWRLKRPTFPRISLILKSYGAALLVFFFFIFLLYLPGTLGDPSHQSPFAYLFQNIRAIIFIFSQHHPNYFLGLGSRHNNWFYFPVAFALKTTLPFFILTALALGMGLAKKITFPPWIWIPPLLFFAFILNVQNMGVRYLLPAFPFLILMGALVLGQLWKWKPHWGGRVGKILVVGLLLWHSVSVLSNYPNMIGYFNDFIPESKKVYYLGDTNLDFGQDVKKFARAAQEKGWKKVKLAQFGGTTDPSFYGFAWSPWTQKDLAGPQPGWVYAVNMTMLQLGPLFQPDLTPIAQSWVINLPPTGRIGNSWIYFEVPGEPHPDSSPALSSVRIF